MKKIFIKIYKLYIFRITIYYIKLLYFPLKIIYLNYKKKKFNKIVVIPHNGIGDLIVILTALEYLSNKYDKVYLLCDKKRWSIINQCFIIPNNIKNITFNKNPLYRISNKKKSFLKTKGLIFFLGEYGFDPIFSYPNSMFLKLMVPLILAEKKLEIKFSDTVLNYFKINLNLNFKFNYINLVSSHGEISNSENFKIQFGNYVKFIDESKLELFYNNSVSFIELNPDISFSINLLMALKSEKCIITDSSMYNILIRLNHHPDIILYTRKTFHSHSKKLYQHPFDGGRYNILKK